MTEVCVPEGVTSQLGTSTESQLFIKVSLHSVSKKCQLIFRSVSVEYEPISIKICRPVLEETFNKTMHKVHTSTKICASTTLGNLT